MPGVEVADGPGRSVRLGVRSGWEERRVRDEPTGPCDLVVTPKGAPRTEGSSPGRPLRGLRRPVDGTTESIYKVSFDAST